MALRVASTLIVSLQTTSTEIVPPGSQDAQRRIIFTLYNADSATHNFTIYELTGAEAEIKRRAVHGFNEPLAAKNRKNMDTYLLGPRRLTGLADANDEILIKVTILQIS